MMKNLLLITLDGMTYGIWEDESGSIEDLKVLHRLPLSPACVAGLSIINNRTVALSDLSVCLGHRPLAKGDAKHLLLLSDREKFAGFVIEGEIKRTTLSSESALRIPGYLATPVIDSCVSDGGRLIPIINLSVLFDSLRTSEWEPFSPACTAPLLHDGSPAVDRVRLAGLDCGRFAISMDETSLVVAPGLITPLTNVPQFIAGIALHDTAVLPVIDLCRRLTGRKAGQRDLMFVTSIGGTKFGFLIDTDLGQIVKEQFEIKKLPPIACSRRLQSAVVCDGNILPLIDLKEVISLHADEEDEMPLAKRYLPDSIFPSLFGKKEVEVVEFLLLGARHAIPSCEVVDNIGFTSYCPVPDVRQIVIGVAMNDGDILPVLDLAMVFGRRSPITTEWRMFLVRNGDFRALVLSEAIFNARRLPLDQQRALPIALTHRVVYGCYPEVDSVRLVLDVRSLAVHFEEALVQELLPAMTAEMKQASVQIEPSQRVANWQATPVVMSEQSSQGDAGEAPVQEEESVIEGSMQATRIATDTGFENIPISTPDTDTRKIAYPLDVRSSAFETSPEPSLEYQQTSEKQTDIEQAAGSAPIAAEDTETPLENTVDAVVSPSAGEVNEGLLQVASAEVPEHAVPVEAVADGGVAATEGEVTERESEEKKDDIAKTEDVVPEIPRVPEPLTIPEEEPWEQEQPLVTPGDLKRDSEEEPVSCLGKVQDPSSIPEGFLREPVLTLGQGPRKEDDFPIPRERNDGRTNDRWKVYGAITAALIVLVVIASVMYKRGPQPPAATTSPTSTSIGTVPREARKEEVLVFEVPATWQADTNTTYHVEKGDTLWDISGRLTGNSLNYPQIAGENRIADPDLIFPGQRIILKSVPPDAR